jgi:nucleotide-binding universal stress UspA family protein
MYETILVPTDGSEHAIRAAEQGCYLASLFDATVHVLSVVDVADAGGLFDAGGVDERFVDRLDEQAEAAIEEIETVAGTNLRLRTAVEHGDPFDSILEYAEEHDADLIAMGTHGRSGLGRYVFGSVTERVLRRSELPVLTTRATQTNEAAISYDEILLPIDGSGVATAVVDQVRDIAQATAARIHLVHVTSVGAHADDLTIPAPDDLVDAAEQRGTEATTEIAELVREADLDTVQTVRRGTPAEELLGYAEDEDIDLIAMATAGRRGLDRLLLGSTTERIIRKAAMPVLAVPLGRIDE